MIETEKLKNQIENQQLQIEKLKNTIHNLKKEVEFRESCYKNLKEKIEDKFLNINNKKVSLVTEIFKGVVDVIEEKNYFIKYVYKNEIYMMKKELIKTCKIIER